MAATQLVTRSVEKIWGRRDLGFGFADPAPGAEPVGEIWFEAPGDASPELLVKYLFTSEKLSVQVHPDDDAAQASGHPRGKEECWLILDAEPGAVLGLGLTGEADAETLRAAAEDGSIETLLDWRPVKPDNVFYLPAGTIHAIGAGITLIEVQQNVDLTYRLYDYGRPRTLHLDEAIGVAEGKPWKPPNRTRTLDEGRRILAEGRKFVLERWTGERSGLIEPQPDRPVWLVPITGKGRIGDDPVAAGEAWMTDAAASFDFDGDLLITYPDGEVAEDLWRTAG